MFTVHMLDAAHGDCLWIEYGDPARPKRILIDTGPAATWTQHLYPKIQAVVDAEGECVFELFVVTHVDDDHIGGSLRFLDEIDPETVRIKEIWFNGYFNLSDQVHSVLGPDQGEKLTELIVRGGWPWNRKFNGRAVMVPREGALKTFTFAGMKLTVLSPTFEKMQALKKTWEKVIREQGLVPGSAYVGEETVLPGGFLGADVDLLAQARFKDYVLASDVLFAFGKSGYRDMTFRGHEAIRALAAQLKQDQVKLDHIEVIGHTDPIGSQASNQVLGLKRAQTVRRLLLQSGLSSSSITASSAGSDESVSQSCEGSRAEQIACYAEDRRVVVRVNTQR